MTGIRPAPKHLAMLAAEMRADWPYDETRAALIAASHAGWDPERIYRETFRLLLVEDATPADLRHASRDPRRNDTRPGPGLPTRSDAVELVAAYRAQVAATQTAGEQDDVPEGDEAA